MADSPYEARMLIGGARPPVDEDRAIDVHSPLTGARIAVISDASAGQVHDAVGAAQAAYDETWRTTNGAERAQLMHRFADLLDEHATAIGELESRDNGKLVRETTSQARFAARNYRFFAGLADKLHGRTIPLDQWETFDYTTRESVGVAALITAWNSPMQLLANKLAPALAAGCTTVVKPSEVAPLSTVYIAELLEEAGFPPGVVNIVTGGPAAGEALVTDPRLGRISFTGSVPVGQQIARLAAQNLTPVTLELGGKSANIVFEDADLDRAVVGAVAGIFAAGGQTCIAGSRLLVHESIAQEIEQRVSRRAGEIVLGDPTDAATNLGPVASKAQQDRITAMIAAARESGARLASGGGTPRPPGLADGYFVEPTVFADVPPDSQLANEEVFGPVLAMTTFADEQEAIRIANGTRFGLAAGIWTQDLSRAHRVARELVCGTVWVNTYRQSAAQAPFGGVKLSGYGRERGVEAIDEYLRTKNVLIDLSDEVRDPFQIKT
ncbi:aldehyde dehydrogenase [Cumulibacter manganitolerans]|uniref:aldehyde dehydrogenase n=1 Tax=Cumulibacter manganitolerans TaxID=1884992 RepID=UPI001E4B06FB|nr:aldehyde dehydrogenase [Cumulibacter manganitolerans]